MKLSQKDFNEIAHKMHRRSTKCQVLVVLGGILIISVITAYSMPTQILEAAFVASTSSFLSFISSWQAWLCVAPVFAYFIVVVELWDKTEDAALAFWWNVLHSTRILTDD